MSDTAVDPAASLILLNTTQAARILRVHTSTVNSLCRRGKLPAMKIGREWRINHADLLAYLGVPGAVLAKRQGGSADLTRDELRIIADFTRDWEFWLEPDRCFRFISPSCERISGYTPADFLAAPDLFLDIVHSDDRPAFEAALGRALAGKPEYGLDYRITTQNGALAWVSLAFQSIHAADGRFLGVRGSIRDTGALHELRRQLQEANARLKTEAAQLEARAQERTAELQAAYEALSLRQTSLESLLRSAQRLNSQLNLNTALRAVCEEARQTLRLPAAWINLYDPQRDVLAFAVTDGMPPSFGRRYASPARALLEEYAQRMGRLVVFPDVQVLTDIPNAQLYANLNIRTVGNAIMMQQGQLVGVLSVVTFGEIRQFSAAELALLEGLANQAALAIANARLFDGLERELAERRRAEQALVASREQLQTLSRRLVEVQEEERRSLSRELHDETGQVMTALKLGLGVLRRQPACTDEMTAMIDELRVIAEEATESLHRLALNLRPSSLDRYGLAPALEGYLAAFVKQTGVRVEFAAEGDYDERLASGVETALYRIVQEALTNIARHAEASRVSVMLQRRKNTITVLVEDNGVGFDVEEAFRKGRLGLLGIRERAEMLGGALTIESGPGSGTTLYVNIPLEIMEAPTAEAPDDRVRLSPGGMLGPTESAAILPEAELARARILGDVVNNIIDEIALLHDPDLMLERALQRVAEALGNEAGLVVVRDGDEWVVHYGYRIDSTLRGLRSGERDFPQYLADAISSRQVLVINDARNDSRFTASEAVPFGLQAALVVPLIIGGEVAAVVGLNEYSHPRRFTPTEVRFAERLKESLSLALDNARLRQELEQRVKEQTADLAAAGDRLQYQAMLLDMVSDAIVIADRDYRVRMWNRAAEELYGLPATEAIGQLSHEATGSRMTPRQRAAILESLAETGRWRGELLHSRRDGTPIVVEVNAMTVHDADGRVSHHVTVFRDITKRKGADIDI